MQKLLNEVNLSAWEIISEIWNFILIDIQGQAVRMSNLRFEIDRLCRAAVITIAFPQRDVHLDTLKPLEIRLHSDSGVAEAQAHQKDHSKPNKS